MKVYVVIEVYGGVLGDCQVYSNRPDAEFKQRKIWDQPAWDNEEDECVLLEKEIDSDE